MTPKLSEISDTQQLAAVAHVAAVAHGAEQTSVDDELAERVARRVVELLREAPAAPERRFVSARELAGVLGVSRDTVYEHADALGALRREGQRRSRLRFDLDRALEAWSARSGGVRSLEVVEPVVAPVGRGGRPRRSGTGGDLLPIRGELAA